jgi:hypothetical protein
VVDVNAHQVVIPGNWNLPVPITTDKYSVRLEASLIARATDKGARGIVEGILREAIKLHFKKKTCPELGDLWQDFNSFCQYPVPSGDEEHIMCRRFEFGVKLLSGGLWVVRLSISTTLLDSWTFGDYYARGEVRLLADRLEAKRRNRVTRKNRPSAVRVLQQYKRGSSEVRALDFEDYDLLMDHVTLSPERQIALGVQCLRCSEFKKGVIGVPIDELRLILDTQITQEDHSDTIIGPAEREELTRQLRSFVDGAGAYGQTLQLSEEPVDAEPFETTLIPPPDVRVRGADGKEVVIKTPEIASEHSLKARARDRSEHIRRHGFLVRRPIDPLLSWPSKLDQRGGARLKEDLEHIWESQGVQERFRLIRSGDVDEIKKAVEQEGCNALLAVLPERSDSPAHPDLEPRYALKLDEKDISQLSSGEKGALLLVFYLLLDPEQIPIIIDQPEQNLDNESVVKLLVDCIRQARARRQVIIVTHNPNLAVVCDADQVICCRLDKAHGNRVTYEGGAIEDGPINKTAVDVLEGTYPAFDNRRRKYHKP